MNKAIKYDKRMKSFKANKIRKIAALDLFRLNERSYRIYNFNKSVRPE